MFKMVRVFGSVLLSGIFLAGCPKKDPKAVCITITEDNAASNHCSKDKADCEKTLSKLLTDNHSNRCSVPPCTGFSAWVDCTSLNQDCKLGSGDTGLLFSTEEHIRCK